VLEIRERRDAVLGVLVDPPVVDQPDRHRVQEVELLPALPAGDDEPGVLEEAGLVVTRRQGREKLHHLNPVPIRLIHDRWIDKYRERRASALAELKAELEEEAG